MLKNCVVFEISQRYMTEEQLGNNVAVTLKKWLIIFVITHVLTNVCENVEPKIINDMLLGK